MPKPNRIQTQSDWVDPVGEEVALAWAHMYDEGPGDIPTIAEEHLAWINADKIFREKVKKALEETLTYKGVIEFNTLVYKHPAVAVFALRKVLGDNADSLLTASLKAEVEES